MITPTKKVKVSYKVVSGSVLGGLDEAMNNQAEYGYVFLSLLPATDGLTKAGVVCVLMERRTEIVGDGR